MRKLSVGFMIAMTVSGPAWGWAHANRYGGGTAHTFRETAHENAFGGGTMHAYGGGTVHTGAYGTTAVHGGYDHYYGAAASAYHPPVAVNSYSTGCYNCGGWAAAAGMAAGAAVGMAAGAAAASSQSAAATSNAYAAGYAAGTAYAMGAIYPALPGGCTSPNIQGQVYYLCGNTWFSPFYGAGGVSYRVVPTP